MAAKAKTKPPKGERPDVYQVVTDAIVARLEAGVIPWRKPWTSVGGDGVQRNLMSRRAYRGINQLLLDAMGYGDAWWLTANQANSLGAHVRKGEKSSPVSFWKRLRVRPAGDYTGTIDKDGLRTIFMLRYYRVFNVEQIEWGEELPSLLVERLTAGEDEDEPEHDDQDVAMDACLWAYCEREAIALKHRGDQAFYTPLLDSITLPRAAAFHSTADRLSTFGHEAVHSTGHARRLARDGIMAVDSTRGESYAREELVAEMGAAMLGARFGVATDERQMDNRAAYIATWLSALKDDPKMVVQAGGRAQKAVDLIAGPLPGEPTDDEETK